jgi:hypothetical protein
MEHKIIVEYNDKYNFNKLTCTEGHYITDWVEGDDIKKYSSSQLMFTPAAVDVTKYRCVTEEENERLMELQRIAFEEENKRADEEIVEEVE